MLFKLLPIVTLALSINEALADVKFKGVNIAGFDFGCVINGTCTRIDTRPPLLSSGKWSLPKLPTKNNYYADGIGQMQRFTNVDKLNIYRLPVAWQFLVDWKLGGTLDPNAFGLYNDLMQGCLNTKSYCIIDVHSYARWIGNESNEGIKIVGGPAGTNNIVGQKGGPTNEQYGSLWRQLAEKYKNDDRVIFGLANEPWNLDMNTWADTVQYLVTTIRKAGATSQIILLPGTNFTKAEGFETFSAPYLSKVRNLDDTTTNLIYEVHQYPLKLKKNEKFHGECNTDNIKTAFQPLATYLRANKRTVLVAEIGGDPSSATCQRDVCAGIDFFNQNSDVFIGYLGWAAGSFSTSYEFTLTPKGDLRKPLQGTDQLLLTNCIAKSSTGKVRRGRVERG